MTDFKSYIDQYSKLLPVGSSISFTEAERRAGEFLVAQATLANWKHTLTAEKIKLLSVQTAVYADQMSKGSGKTVTQDKITTEASKEYTMAREELESIENDISYLKTYADIFLNGHLFYRSMAKGSNV